MRLELVISAEVLARGGRVDEHQAAYLFGMALGKGQRERAAVGVPDENRPADVQRAEQRVERRDLAVELQIAVAGVAETGPVEGDRAVSAQQRRDLVEVFGGAGQPCMSTTGVPLPGRSR
jgi:hypothetical protein